jgi:hypothetical protein
MSTSTTARRGRGPLVLIVLALLATVFGTVLPAGAAGALPPPGEEQPADPGTPPDDGDEGDDGDGLPPDAPAEIDAVIAEIAEPLAVAAENDAATEFFVAVLLKIADLQARFGSVVGPGQVVPFGVLGDVERELRAFLEPYAPRICDSKLVLPGISEEVQAQLAFRWWYPFVPPYFFGWLFGRKSICASRLIDEAISRFLYPCTIVRGHNAEWWTHEMAADLFASSGEAGTDFLQKLIESGHPSPYEYYERHPPWPVLVCVHD